MPVIVPHRRKKRAPNSGPALVFRTSIRYYDGMNGSADATIAVMRASATVLRSPTSTRAEEFQALQSVVSAAQALQADLLAEVDATKSYEADGASSVTTWARQLTGLDAKSTRQLVRAARTMRD